MSKIIFFMGARGSGKSKIQYKQLCERASELELQIDLAKKLSMPYDNIQKELTQIYNTLDRGRNKTNSKNMEW